MPSGTSNRSTSGKWVCEEMGFTPYTDGAFDQHLQWLSKPGPDERIVVSTRIRLARNLDGFAFPGRASESDEQSVLAAVRSAASSVPEFRNGVLAEVGMLNTLNRRVLLERHLISRELFEAGRSSAVIISRDETCSIMINEEDHVRIQVLLPGLQLGRSWDIINSVDECLATRLHYTYCSQLGFLTACPTNVGTGIRASVMMHLPGLVLSNQINAVLNAVRKLGWTARGFGGEGTEYRGNLFQISNQSTLGEGEEEIVMQLESMVRRLVAHEQNARHRLLEDEPTKLCDHVGRAYGTLRYAYSLGGDETLEYLSALRLGLDLGMLPGVTPELLNDLWITTQTGHLEKNADGELRRRERTARRAALVRASFNDAIKG